MRILSAVALIALLAGPVAVAAQQQPVRGYREADPDKTPAEIAADKAAEKAYKRSLDNIPEQKSSDPWGTVRSDNNAPPKAAAKAVPAKPKSAAASGAGAAKSAAVKTDSPPAGNPAK